MQFFFKFVIAISLVASGICGALAQGGLAHAVSGSGVSEKNTGDAGVVMAAEKKHHDAKLRLTSDDRLSLLAAALDARVQREAEPDCSHLVYAIYKAAGFPYAYAPSADLYAGVESFERVKSPLPGDLVVWHGHVGIVTQPSEHSFYSFLSSGPGTDNYEAPYWRHRGRARFYRYIKKEFSRGVN